MKKLNILLIGMLGILAASCEETIEPAIPQQNGQPPIYKDVTITSEKFGVLASNDVIKLGDYSKTGLVPVMKLTGVKDMPEGVGLSVAYRLEVSPNADFSGYKVIDTTPGTKEETKDIYYADLFDWNEVHLAFFGKNPTNVQKLYYRVPVYVMQDGSDFRYDSYTYYAATGEIEETCIDAGFAIEENYYLLSDATSWALNDANEMASYRFEHSYLNVYEDPTFTIQIKVTKDNSYWKIAPQSIIGTEDWASVLGPKDNGTTDTEGTLVSTDAQAGRIETPGYYKITINMEKLTYKVTALAQPEFLYTPGGSNGWNFFDSARLQYHEDKDKGLKFYYGLTPVNDQGFKITELTNWGDATTWGAPAETPALTGTFVLGSTGKNIMVPAANKAYWVQANYDSARGVLTDYTLTEVSTIGLIGSFAPSNWNDEVKMTTTDNGATWTATVALEAGQEFKVRINDNWDLSLGGTINALKMGDNLKVEKSANYQITLHLLGGAPYLIMAEK